MKKGYFIPALASIIANLVGQDLPHSPFESSPVIDSNENVVAPSSTAGAEGRARMVVNQGDVVEVREAPLGERVVLFEKIRPLILPPIPEPAVAKF
ncbi:MAG: hypothetical protein MUF31_17200 [Akkermansiaceae bacterium]|jgi:hypothetical protein|nr:hypothetical protein [Akkermansiaceae bacterium]